jgi:hypothetical protein
MSAYESEGGRLPQEGSTPAASLWGKVNSKAGKCPCCGRHAVRPVAQPGRVCRYRNAALTLPADLPVPTCGRCKHMLLSFDAVPGLAAALEATYRAELIQRAAVEIKRLGRAYSQRHTQEVLDLSLGYLSRLQAGDGVPSASLVRLLALLAAEPTRLEELKRYWALPVKVSSSAGKRKRGA